MASHLKQALHGLAGELINHIEGTRSVRGTGIITQIQIIVFGQQLTDAIQDSQSAISAVKDTYRTWSLREFHRFSFLTTSSLTSTPIAGSINGQALASVLMTRASPCSRAIVAIASFK